MKQWIAYSLMILSLLSGCAQKPTLATPSSPVATQETPEDPKIYIEDYPTRALFLKQEDDASFELHSIPELSTREMIVQNAMQYLGKRDGGDCSGFVNLINIKSGHPFYNDVELNKSFDNARKSRAMFNLMSQKGHAYETMLPNIGDLVFFKDTERSTKTKHKKTKHKKPVVQNVAENITHVGIVTHVETNGTVEFIHHSNGKNVLDYMNFNYPMLTMKDGKKINTYMKRCPSKNGAAQPQCMNIAFFEAYGTF